ncbi:MAG TPA: DNA-processing protein DprA [Puia sp.]|nr:DNA-processing protein DprA [Puia sp.]
MRGDLPYQLALTFLPNIGCIQAKILLHHFGDAQAIFNAKKSQLEKIEGIGPARADAIKKFANFMPIEKECFFMEKYGIQTLFLSDKDYPQRLLNCYDPPTLLFFKGNRSLNHARTVGIIGTRNNTEYGKLVAEKLIRELVPLDVMIISGLAFGIDAIAHKSALKYKLPTVGVLAHGLDCIYPSQHSSLAKEMLQHGGILTEFRSGCKPDKHHFPIRNRIVAGMCDATIVIETGVKGGSMITAELANGYNRDVFAFPGKITDNKSAGCNQLIKSNKAILLTDTQQLIDSLGWSIDNSKAHTKVKGNGLQKELFVQLSESEKLIVTMLSENKSMHIDELNIRSGIHTSAVAAAILNLELLGIIHTLPGRMYTLI